MDLLNLFFLIHAATEICFGGLVLIKPDSLFPGATQDPAVLAIQLWGIAIICLGILGVQCWR